MRDARARRARGRVCGRRSAIASGVARPAPYGRRVPAPLARFERALDTWLATRRPFEESVVRRAVRWVDALERTPRAGSRPVAPPYDRMVVSQLLDLAHHALRLDMPDEAQVLLGGARVIVAAHIVAGGDATDGGRGRWDVRWSDIHTSLPITIEDLADDTRPPGTVMRENLETFGRDALSVITGTPSGEEQLGATAALCAWESLQAGCWQEARAIWELYGRALGRYAGTAALLRLDACEWADAVILARALGVAPELTVTMRAMRSSQQAAEALRTVCAYGSPTRERAWLRSQEEPLDDLGLTRCWPASQPMGALARVEDVEGLRRLLQRRAQRHRERGEGWCVFAREETIEAVRTRFRGVLACSPPWVVAWRGGEGMLAAGGMSLGAIIGSVPYVVHLLTPPTVGPADVVSTAPFDAEHYRGVEPRVPTCWPRAWGGLPMYDAEAPPFGVERCAHPHLREQIAVHGRDLVALSCDRCGRSRIAVIPRHRLPTRHPAALSEEDISWYRPLRQARAILRGDDPERLPETIREMRRLDGVASLAGADYAVGPPLRTPAALPPHTALFGERERPRRISPP